MFRNSGRRPARATYRAEMGTAPLRLLAACVAVVTALGPAVPVGAARVARLPDLVVRGGAVTQDGTTAEATFKVLRRTGSVRRTRYAAGVNTAGGGWIELGHGVARNLRLGVARRVRVDLALGRLAPGRHQVTACVDSAFTVKESNEDNNCRDIGTVTVRDQEPVDGPAQPVVVGNRLTDARTGATWVPRGVNWPDLEYSCVFQYVPEHPAAETTAMAGWNVNVVRLPLNQDCWLGTDGAPNGDWASAAAYRAAVQDRVQDAHDAGLVVILDLHWTAPAGVLADGQRAMTDAQSVTFWSQVAAAYRDDPSVMFELFNEPYNFAESGSAALTWDCWQNGGCQVDQVEQGQPLSGQTYAVTGMTQLLAAVRDAGAEQPALLGGLNYSNDLTQWLAHRPAGDDQLVAAFHNYDGQGCGPACWNSTILSVAAQVPVVMTEFGYSFAKPNWMANVMAFGDDNGIGYLPWAWWDLPADTDIPEYALLKPGTYQPRAPAGTIYHDHLATLP